MQRPGGFALLALAALGQPAGPQNDAVFRVTTTLVQVDAVVTDGRGRYATDLTAADFVVLEDGKPQPITHFAYVRTGDRAVAGRPRAVPLAPVVGPVAPLKREEVRRTIVLMVDDLGLSFESMAYVRAALRKFVERQMQPGDLVAVCRTASGSGALQQFTNDKRILLSVIDALRWNANGRYGVGVYEPIGEAANLDLLTGGPDGRGGAASRMLDTIRMEQEVVAARNATYTLGTLGAINFITGALRDMPGRKSIVLFSDGLTTFARDNGPRMHRGGEPNDDILTRNPAIAQSMQRLIDRAARAGTVIYTVHAAGLQTLGFDAADRPPAEIGRANAQLASRREAFYMGQEGLSYVSERTGGIAFANTNDMNFALDRVLDDQSGYYLIGYKPSDNTFAGKDGYRSFHKIRVEVKRPGLTVRSRVGFFGATDEETRPKYATPLDELRAAMLSPFRSSEVRLRFTALYYNDPKDGPMIRNLVHIDARDLLFDIGETGSPRGHVDIIALASGPDDQPSAREARSYVFEPKSGRVREALEQGAVYELKIPVKKGGPYRIQVAVRDAATGKMGSASQFLEVPELKKSRIALSSVLLEDGEEPVGTPEFAMSSVRRQFRPGGRVRWACFVVKGAKDKNALRAEIRVLRDAKQIYSTPVAVMQTRDGGAAVAGSFRLSDRMPAGDYYVQVVAADESKKNAVAQQWTDFEVVAPR